MISAQRILEQVRTAGERVTPQRQMVIQALAASGAHLTLQEVREYITDEENMTLAEPTIYRILQWLKDLGIIAQTDIAERGVVYQIISTPPHHHLICLHCNRIIDIDDRLMADLRQQLQQLHGFQARIDHMAIYGLCPECGG